jgi:tetratricopeptide (TPR) repeat protein
VYEQNGDELRAAEQEINAASLQIDAGSDQIGALRRARNAHATLRKHGSVEFEIIAMQVEASSYLYSGRQAEARKQLLTALSLARDRHLNGRIAPLTVKLAESYFMTSEYEAARVLLEEIAASDEGRDHPEVAIALGRVLVRLGDFDNARGRLERALADIEASGRLLLAPVAQLALGELEYESRNLKGARGHFDQAGSYWVDNLPGAASVEAQCYRGLLESAQNAAAARSRVETSVAQARKMGRPHLESQCRVHEARIHFGERRYADAVAALKDVPMDGEQSVGPELRAHVHHWRSRALGARGDAAQAESEGALARKAARELQASLPAPYRARFESRPDIRAIVEERPREQP